VQRYCESDPKPVIAQLTGGRWNYDPTNHKEINEQYISVGVGRDYADITPLKGIYSGTESTDLDVAVEITRLA